MAVSKKKDGSSKQKKVNPFELKFNRSKHNVLGKTKGAAVGAPTASRKRAFEQREKTLGVEYDRKNKVSKIVDKRLGEKEGKTEEEKNAMRFTEERTKNFKKASKFNLTDDNDEEEDVLTHRGRALTDIQKYDKDMVSDSDDDDDPGNIGSKMVKVAHFGGGETVETDRWRDKLSRMDMITNLIAKSKMAKHDKQAAKDELEMLTDSLDSKYQSLLAKMSGSFRPAGRQPQEKDDYDKLALTLKIESDNRATPSERKMSEAEMATKEKERLENLEAARISKTNANYNSHISADADVDYYAGSKADNKKEKLKKAQFEVRFEENGNIIDEDMIEKATSRTIGESSDEDEMEDEEEEDMDDLMEDEDELEDDDDENEEEVQTKQKKASEKVNESTEDGTVPFVFEMPKNYKRFCELLEKYTDNMSDVLERLIKCHHPSLKEGNKKRLNKLFLFCLRLFDDMSKEELNERTIMEMNLAQKTMHSLLKFDVLYGVRCIRALIRQYWKNRQEDEKNKPASFGLVALLRMVSVLFPVDTNWHPVVVPAFLLAINVITTSKIASLTSLARQVFLATTMLDFVSENRRYVPELVSFARSALLLAVEDKPESFSSTGFPVSKPHSEMLCVNETKKNGNEKVEPISLRKCFDEDSESENGRNLQLSVLRALFSLIQHLSVVYSNMNTNYNAIFKPFSRILANIDKKNFPADLNEEFETLVASMNAECEANQRLVQKSIMKTEKSMLKMLEPRFEEDFDPEKPYKGKHNEKKKMQKQLKNEMRGAVKELRKDTAFLARKQMVNVKSKDKARSAATKRLMGGLMQQQGEWNKEMRTKEVEVKKGKI